jgi:hypothetical protein
MPALHNRRILHSSAPEDFVCLAAIAMREVGELETRVLKETWFLPAVPHRRYVIFDSVYLLLTCWLEEVW